jgi:NAD(P)-dependent dehydrogenase (short-subunit alcohol dehydrogenase family)
MLLEGKNAVVYGAAGSIGGAIARAFAREGARVFLAGRTKETLEAVADDIRAGAGAAETAVVDALDKRSVDEHADAVVAAAGSLDISISVISHPFGHGTPLVDMAAEDVTAEVVSCLRAMHLTASAAARHMIGRRSGVILAFGGDGDPLRDYYIGGSQIGFGAVEVMRRQLAAELGRHGIRVVTLRTGGVPESLPDFEGREQIIEDTIVAHTMLNRAATLEDVGHVAAFVASDRARSMTAATANVSCGALID